MKNLMTISEVAALLRVDDSTVRRWIKEGSLKAVILPHARTRQVYRIKRTSVDAILDIGDEAS